MNDPTAPRNTIFRLTLTGSSEFRTLHIVLIFMRMKAPLVLKPLAFRVMINPKG